MKKIILFTLTFLVSLTNIQAQCPNQDITLTSQEEVDAFAANYPGCTELLEGLIIQEDNTSITDLSGLSQVTLVNGDLKISFNYALTSLSGLENITSIGGELRISRNDILPNLIGLDNVTTVGGLLDIWNNDNW